MLTIAMYPAYTPVYAVMARLIVSHKMSTNSQELVGWVRQSACAHCIAAMPRIAEGTTTGSRAPLAASLFYGCLPIRYRKCRRV